jgi:hypothetical protein
MGLSRVTWPFANCGASIRGGSAGAGVLSTMDDSLRLRALREANKVSVHVENPAKWYAEVITP